MSVLNTFAIAAIYRFEMSRWARTVVQSIATPVITTCLYFVVFGSAMGGRIQSIDSISYAAFIVPGLIMLSVLTESLMNASFAIYMPKFAGTIYEVLSAPIGPSEILLGYIGAAATKSMLLGLIIMSTARLFVPFEIAHPLAMIAFLALTSISFSLFGFLTGLWADGWEKLQIAPTMIITPLTFLGGSFYSIQWLPEPWKQISLMNPVLYLVSGFRWSFFDQGDVNAGLSLAMALLFTAVCGGLCAWALHTGWRMKT